MRTTGVGRKVFHISHPAQRTEKCNPLIVMLSGFCMQVDSEDQLAEILVSELLQTVPATATAKQRKVESKLQDEHTRNTFLARDGYTMECGLTWQ
jgi:hypothetical protein